MVRGLAVVTARRCFENDAERLPSPAVIIRARRADSGDHLFFTGPALPRANFVVVIAVPGSVHVRDEAFHPDATARPWLEGNRDWFSQMPEVAARCCAGQPV